MADTKKDPFIEFLEKEKERRGRMLTVDEFKKLKAKWEKKHKKEIPSE